MSARELKGLSTSGVPHHKRRTGSLVKPSHSMPQRMQTLFHGSGPPPAKSLGSRIKLLHETPPIYAVHNFLSARELDQLNALISCSRSRFQRSKTDFDGVYLSNSERTSTSLVLNKSSDAVLRTIESRAADLVGMPSDHVEPIQVVRYVQGARFYLHHDVAPICVRGDDEAAEQRRQTPSGMHSLLDVKDVHVEMEDGPRRLVTVFVYLNTLPDGVGGHTEFPFVKCGRGDFSVRPRCGMALVFCNVDATGQPDARLCHRAGPAHRGYVKYGLSIWISSVTQQAYAAKARGKPRKTACVRWRRDHVGER